MTNALPKGDGTGISPADAHFLETQGPITASDEPLERLEKAMASSGSSRKRRSLDIMLHSFHYVFDALRGRREWRERIA